MEEMYLVARRPEQTEARFVAELDQALWQASQDSDPVLAFDTETGGLDVFAQELLFIQMKFGGNPTLLIDCRNVPYAWLSESLRPYFESGEWLVVAHNWTFDWRWMAHKLGIKAERIYCTMLAERLLTAGLKYGNNQQLPSDLKAVAKRYLGVEMDKDIRKEFPNLADQPLTQRLIDYMIGDVDYLVPIMKKQIVKLRQFDLLRTAQLEFEVLPALCEAHLHGVFIDSEAWQAVIDEMEGRRVALEGELCDELQDPVTWWRSQQYGAAAQKYIQEYALYLAAAGQRQALEETAQAEAERLVAEYVSGGQMQASEAKGVVREAMTNWRKANPPVKIPAPPKWSDGPINLGSPDQLQGALDMLDVPLERKANGKLETDHKHLAALEGDDPMIEKLLAYREAAKVVESFGEAVLKYMDSAGRLHPDYNQLVSTGRMSCRAPNVQQIPKGSKFRSCFRATPGRAIVSADYSQIELRILCAMSGSKAFLAAFKKDIDLHSLTALQMFGQVQDALGVSREMVDWAMAFIQREATPGSKLERVQGRVLVWLRRVLGAVKHVDEGRWRGYAKTINFGIPYGRGPQGLLSTLPKGTPLQVAKDYIALYFESNPEIDAWLKKTKAEALQVRWTETNEQSGKLYEYGWASDPLGRKRFFRLPGPEPRRRRNSDEFSAWIKAKGSIERQAGNHPIQGGSATITKAAVVRIRKAFLAEGLDATMVLFVHDEICAECAADQAEAVQAVMLREMKAAAAPFLGEVPCEISSEAGEVWEH